MGISKVSIIRAFIELFIIVQNRCTIELILKPIL